MFEMKNNENNLTGLALCAKPKNGPPKDNFVHEKFNIKPLRKKI